MTLNGQPTDQNHPIRAAQGYHGRMSALIFRLRNVPDDEAQDVRDLLEQHSFEWFETTAGNWGIAMPGLWLSHEADVARARALIDQYQQSRSIRLREELEQRQSAGLQPRLLDRLAERPFACAGIFGFCAFLVYVTLWPFLRLAISGTS
jgi:hypothetical protein